MPRARGLFQRAIPQSGAGHTANPIERAVTIAERMLQRLETSDPAALRSKTPAELLRAAAQLVDPGRPDPQIGGMPLQPVIDGHVLPALPIESIASGSAAGVAVMVGSTLEEWKLFGAMDPGVGSLDDEGLKARLRLPAADAAALVEAYRKAHGERGEPVGAADLFFAIQTDRAFRMPGLRLAEAQAPHDSRVYSYLFSWKSPLMGGLLGACHALELGFVFGTYKVAGLEAFCGSGPEADALARAMQDSWLAFARTGDPSAALVWPTYDAVRRATMVFDGTSCVGDAPYEAERVALASLPDSAIGTL
jgi:carboxylesterase type B